MDDCIFCKIINSELPAYKVYEDDDFIVILDRFPSRPGHTLVISKRHIENIYGVDGETAGKAFKLTVRIANALKKALSPDGMNILQNNGEFAGQSITHFHIHLIPRWDGDGITIKYKTCDPQPEEFDEILIALRLYV